MATEVLNDKYVRLCIRLLAINSYSDYYNNDPVFHRMTVDKNIIPLYKRMMSLGKYILNTRNDHNRAIEVLSVYSILRARMKDRDINVYYDIVDKVFVLHRTRDSIPIRTYKDFEKHNTCRSGIIGLCIPEEALLPGADINGILLSEHGGSCAHYRSLVRENIMVYKINRVAKIIFDEIPPHTKKNRYDFERDIDFLFQ
jgi:hypothetical protein